MTYVKIGLIQSINCTVVELKHKIKRRNTIQCISINCTVVELKLGTLAGRGMDSSINCTVVELKHNMHCKPENSHIVLIVPLWN